MSDPVRDALRDMLELIDRHSWLSRDRPRIAAARAVLAAVPHAAARELADVDWKCANCGSHFRSPEGPPLRRCTCGGICYVTTPEAPYSFCRHPDKCAGLSSCPRDPCCAD